MPLPTSESEPEGKPTATWLQRLTLSSGCAVAIVAVGGILALCAKFPLVGECAIATFLIFGVQLQLEEILGKRPAAILLLSLAAIATLIAVIAKVSGETCLIVECCVSAVLLYSPSAFPPEGPAATLIRGFSRVMLTLTAVTAALCAISSHLNQVPPQHILDWGDRLERAVGLVEKTETTSTILLVAMIAIYFLSFEWKLKEDWFEITWRWHARSRRVLEQVSLVLACLAAFTFVADGTSNSPLAKLTETRANALAEYRDIVWQIEISLQAKVTFDVAQSLYDQSPPSAKQALEIENDLVSRNIPAAYYQPGYTGMTLDAFLLQEDPRTARLDPISRAARTAVESERGKDSGTMPSVPVSLSQLDAIREEANNLGKSDAPRWMTGFDSDVLNNLVELVVSADRIPVLRLVATLAPLAGKMLDVSFDALDDATTAKIRRLAIQTANERLVGHTQSLAQGLAQARDEVGPQLNPQAPSPAEWNGIEKEVYAGRETADSARERCSVDLKNALYQEERSVAEKIAEYGKLAEPGQSNDLLVESGGDVSLLDGSDSLQQIRHLLKSDEISLNKLKAEREASDFADSRLGDLVYSSPGNARLKTVLGNDLDRYRSIGQQQETERVRVRQAETLRVQELQERARPAEHEVVP